ncbi:periplasmic beta-glucosidase precursor [Pyrenochaeta sp. DS3sAY3a]|nr:periplasmic beta-glucosidase precursor [Pyrenochaeta sp. DS3sAY3a]
MAVDIDFLISQLTLEEKISFLAGESTWRTAGVERLGIPNIKLSDGPSGARGEIFGEGVPAAFFPSGVSLGATWDVALLQELGELLAEETKSKSASVILSPTMCLARNVLGGRNFETYGEDPYHVGKLATALVKGVQSQGIGATPKHFVANDSEIDRFHGNRVIPTRALRECYLKPFQMVVRDADPWCMMSAYNKVNGEHCDASRKLLTDVARKEWGWEGLIMSDWGGTTAAGPSINAGLDLEMPGPPTRRTQSTVSALIEGGEVDAKQIDESVRRILHLLVRSGRFDDSSDNGEVCLNTPEQAAKLRRAACAGIVLLKNENKALPIHPSKALKKLAVVGPNAQRVVAGGGGSSYIKAPYWTSVLSSLEDRFAEHDTEVVHHRGANVSRYVPTAPSEQCRDPYTNYGGGAVDWWHGHEKIGKPVATTHVDDLYFISFGDRPAIIPNDFDFNFSLSTVLKPRTTGLHKLSLSSIGPAQMFVDDQLLISETGELREDATLFFTYGSEESITQVHLTAGREYRIRIEGHSHDRQLDRSLDTRIRPMENKFFGVRFGYEEADYSDLPAEAAQLCRESDAAIVVVGRDKEWETEGQDIPQFALPGDQVRLIEEVAAVCPRTIVVVQAGTPIKLEPWIHKVQALVYTWYQGQELGNAAADVLCGSYNPSGRLPVVFPREVEHSPGTMMPLEPGVDTSSVYAEGIHVGHRYLDFLGISPIFPLGFGLSYSSFELSNVRMVEHALTQSQSVIIHADVRNVGGSDVPARQTILAFIAPVGKSYLTMPVKTLCSFAKTPELKTGEGCTVELDIDAYDLGVYDALSERWIIPSGAKFDILIGTDSSNASRVGQLDVEIEISWVHCTST